MAINYGKGHEGLFLRNSENEVIQENVLDSENEEEEKVIEEDEGIFIEDYAKIIENALADILKLSSDDDEFNTPIPLAGDYKDPICRVIDKSDIPD